MGQVCDENISCLHSRSNSRTPPTPGRIPSVPGKSHPHQEPGRKKPGRKKPPPLVHNQKAGGYKI